MQRAILPIAIISATLASCTGNLQGSVLPIPRGTPSTKVIASPSLVQTATITSSLGATLPRTPAAGDLLIAVGFNAASPIGCAPGWTPIRHVTAKYVDAQDCYRIVNGDTAAETPFSGTAASVAGQIWEIGGEASSGFIDAQAGAESTTARSVTLTYAPAFSGDLVVGASAINTKLAGTVPAGFTSYASFAPAGTTGFSDLAAHESAASSGTQSVTWSYNSTTDTHPVTAEMIAVDGLASTATPSSSPTPTLDPPTPDPSVSGPSVVQSGTITGSLGTTLRTAPVNGDLLVAVGFNGKSSIGCAANWTIVRHVAATYVKGQSCYRIASSETVSETPFAGTAADISGEIWEIGGQSPSGFIDAQTGAEAGPRTVTLTFSPAHSGDLIVGGSAINTKLIASVPAGFLADASSSPSGSTGFSDSAAHQVNAAAGTEAVTWAYTSQTDTHPVTALMLAVDGSAATPAPSPSPSPANWLTEGYDLQRSGYNPNESTLGVSTIGGLHALWAQPVKIAGEIGEPVYAAGVLVNGAATNVLYASSGMGQAIALNADTGAVIWTHQMSTANYSCGGSTYTFGATGTAAIDRAHNRIFVPDGADNVHALNMSTGAELSGWPVTIATAPDHNFIYSAVTYNPANGMLYAETSSTCEISPWYGRITAINTTSAGIVNTFYPAQGASGGGIWGFGGASIDPSTNDVYIEVGNGDSSSGTQTAGYSEQVVTLAPDLSTVLGHYYAMLPPASDADFGGTPLLFQPPGCALLAAAVNKSGLFVLYGANNVGAGPVQSIQMSINTDNGDFIGSPAYDPVTNEVYIGLPATEGIYKPGLGAFSMQSNCTLNPTPVWSANFGADGAVLTQDDTMRSPISIANGIVYVSDYDTSVTYAFNAATGAQLWSAPLSGKGVAGPIVVNGHLYTSDISGTINAWSP